MPNLSKHKEQFERVRRWYERFKSINDGQIHNKNSDFYLDDVYAFFINCFHLMDWIANDDTVVLDSKSDKGEKEEYIREYTKTVDELKLCRDLCISVKHLYLKNKPYSKQEPKIVNKSAKLHVGTGQDIIEMRYTINTSSGLRDAYDIATKCMEAWDKFYFDNNLR
jgi:hypothetical protein